MGLFSSVETYAPDSVFLTVGGANVEGWNKITVRRSSPEFTTVRGIRGKHTRVRNKDGHSIITVELDQTSKWNSIMKSILAKDLASGGCRIELQLSDRSGGEVFSSTEAFLRGSSERTYTKDISPRTWVFECLDGDWGSQGSAGLIDSIFSMF